MTYTVETERGGISLAAVVVPMGRDLLVGVAGGDAPHIGCAALAVPGDAPAAPAKRSATVSTLNVAGHRDGEAADRMALRIAAALGAHVAVVCGVHVDAITPQGIQAVREAADELAERIIQKQRSLT